MNTQNTPVHICLWHRGFWLLVIANMLMYMSVTALIPTLPLWMTGSLQAEPWQAGVAMLSFGLGIYLLGGFCSYLVQRFRRNRVCLWAIIGSIVSLGALYLINDYGLNINATDGNGQTVNSLMQVIDVRLVWAARLISGALYGLSQMVLSSTLIIDKTEAFRRTEANHAAAWFRRFAISTGPAIAVPLYMYYGFNAVLLASAGCALSALILIRCVRFSFKSPDENQKLFTLDRFFLPQSRWLFVNMMTITVVLGLIMSGISNPYFYAIMMGGFLLAIIAERYMFADADLKSEAVIGLILIGMALLLLLTRTQNIVGVIAPTFLGFGFGITGSRFLLFFIKLSRHCQRGTSQSSFLLSWETGLALGLAAGYIFFYGDKPTILTVALAVTVANLALYIYVTHPWYINHKNR